LIVQDLGEGDAVVIADGSGFPKQGASSVGVARQYCGHLGKVANCQEGVFLVYVSSRGYAFLDGNRSVGQSQILTTVISPENEGAMPIDTPDFWA
jgi:hypothetical protein